MGTINIIESAKLLKETALGFELDLNPFLLFFGKANSNLETLPTQFPHLSFAKIKQVHGDICISVDSKTPLGDLQQSVGDALTTLHPQIALCISTADCMPVLLFDSMTNRIASVHAGWRGFVEQIVEKVVIDFISQGSDINNIGIAIGPHIGPESFAVDRDVRDLIVGPGLAKSGLAKSIVPQRGDSQYEEYRPEENKYYLNLNQLLRQRLMERFKVKPHQILSLDFDTVKDSRFHSFRRDRDKSGRQLSFIARSHPIY